MKFCGNCGAALAHRCARCGAENPASFKFCGQCGAPLRPQEASEARPAGAGTTTSAGAFRVMPEQAAAELNEERKTVTALFADIKGSMELMEELDPEEARALVDPALNLMIESAHHYSGYIVQSTGDGIFALFGAPVAHEDHAHRALYAALRMQNEMRRYSARLREVGNPPLEIRIGINTGEVVVRSLRTAAHTEYTPIGHSMNLAARMQTLAPTGSIAVTEATQKLTAGYFEFKPLGPTRVKGVSDPVNVYEVVGLGGLRTRLQISAQRGLSRFVGRQHELEQLRRALVLAQGRRGQIIAVVAEAGVGKSRLFHEFKLSQNNTFVMEAFSFSHGRASPYLPVIGLLKDYFRIGDQDDERTQREKITGRVLALDRALEDTMPYLFALLGIQEPGSPLDEMDSTVRRRRTREAIKSLIHRESLDHTLLLIFEDLHWIDTESQSLLDLLADSIGTAPILLMVNYRPEYEHHWSNKTYYTQLRLDPLGGQIAVEMLSELIGSAAELQTIRDLIIARTEGNPFFMEEMVRALFDQGVLARNGSVSVARPLASIQIPPTVQGILAARIDQLAAVEKELLQTLAVIGKEFPFGLVQRVSQRTDNELERGLERLQLGEFIYERPAFPESEYTFKHALTQEVAYNSVLIERRRELHERTAAAMEEIFAAKLDEQVDALAHHYSRSGNAPKAVAFLRRAAEQARTRSAYDEALGYVNEALRLLADMPDSRERDRDEVAIHGIRGLLLAATKGFAAAEIGQCLNRGIELCKRIGEGPEMYGVMFGLWTFNLARNRLHDAMKLAEKILGLSRLMNTELAAAAAHSAYGATCLWRGEFLAAYQHLQEANAAYDRDLDRFLPMYNARVVPSRAETSWALWMIGCPDQAHARAEEAVALATRLRSPFSMVFALMHAIALAHLRGDYGTIRLRAETMMQIAREQGFPYWSAIASMVIGRTLVGEGSHDAGIICMRDAMATLRETGGELIYNYALSLLAESYLEARDPEKGLAAVTEALKVVEVSGQHMHEAELWRLRGELLILHRDAEAEAEGSFHHALQVAQSQRARSWELRAATSLARLLRAHNRPAEAKSYLASTIAAMTEGFENADFRQASELLAQVDSQNQ
jgi:class 3 adenylate cyclase/tetratricopeptide (TPR) repeat protein